MLPSVLIAGALFLAQPLAAGGASGLFSAVADFFGEAWPFLLLAIGFSIVIFVHELGHFLAAKWAGVRVERFAIGFGRELFGFTKGGTRYCLNILPLGGYVKMLGQEDFVVDKSGELKVKDDPNSFTNKSIGKRMAIISAGVVMNLLFAAGAFAIVVMVGRLQPPPIIGEVRQNSPAARAGLQPGDEILKVNGTTIRHFGDLSARIMLSDSDEILELTVRRDGKIVDPPPRVLPEFNKDEEVRQIGFFSGMNRRVREPAFRPADVPREDELHEFDELQGLIVAGEVQPLKHQGGFYRAIAAARGSPVEMTVKRPKDPALVTDELALMENPTIETRDVTVKASAIWAPLAYKPDDPTTVSLLGLVPRLTVLGVDKGKSFDKAGVQPGDVLASIGNYAYPSFAEIRREIEGHPDQELPIEVCRTRAANHGLAGQTVEFCTAHREELIAAALRDVGEAATMALEQAAAAGLPPEEQDRLLAKLGELRDGPAWRRWLERVDVHTIGPVAPRRPFALFKKQTPRVDATVYCLDEGQLLVADVVEKLGDHISPAKAAGIPRGAVIVAADGQPLRHWFQLSEVFRAKAGRAVELTYRVADEPDHKTTMAIPGCVTVALDLPAEARIVGIAGKDSHAVEVEPGKAEELSLPDWRVVEALFKDAVGQTVEVEYVPADGEKRTGSYAVTADNADPWLHRVWFLPSFSCFPLLERHPIHNPIAAIGVGFQQAYQATMQTIQSIRHMVFTRKVGVSKISGPVGIVRMGARFADSGALDLLWFLAVISANLAVINFLPMPIVDGGLFLFLLMEKLRGEPVSIKTQIATQLIGIALIATLFILITYQDIKNWILGA